jgi:hydrogenase-1 operon protein HyaE
MNRLHPLVRRLVDEGRASALTADTLADWTGRPGDHVIFFSGDAAQFGEGPDVAVVLPELQAATGRRFDIGVVPRSDEQDIARRYGVNRWPSLVFVREGGYVATLSGMRDWGDFVEAVQEALAATPTRAPGIGIPVVATATPSCH